MKEMDRVFYGLLTCMKVDMIGIEYMTLIKGRLKHTFWFKAHRKLWILEKGKMKAQC